MQLATSFLLDNKGFFFAQQLALQCTILQFNKMTMEKP